jgi:hypothetical protein
VRLRCARSRIDLVNNAERHAFAFNDKRGRTDRAGQGVAGRLGSQKHEEAGPAGALPVATLADMIMIARDAAYPVRGRPWVRRRARHARAHEPRWGQVLKAKAPRDRVSRRRLPVDAASDDAAAHRWSESMGTDFPRQMRRV